MKKLICVFLILCFLPVWGCGILADPSDTAEEFLELISLQKFDEAYDLTWIYSPIRYTKDEFVEKYKNIYSGLQIKSVEITDKSLHTVDSDLIYTYTAKYNTAYGEIRDDFEMSLKPTEEGYAVDYSPSLIFPEMDFGDTVKVTTQNAKRGEILTSDAYVLAQNSYAYTVYIKFDEVQDINKTALDLAVIVNVSASDILDKYDSAKEKEADFTVVKTYLDLDKETIDKIEQIEAVHVDNSNMTPIRNYPDKKMAAHITGYATQITKEDLENLQEDSEIPLFFGRNGLEQSLNDELTEKSGTLAGIFDENNNLIRTLYEQPKKDGQTLVLNINNDLQERAYLSMVQYLKEGQSGAVVVLNGDTGAVLSLVSYPSFDPNSFTLGISEDEWKNLISKESLNPMYSRFSQGLYPPGSTLKPFTIVPALDSGVITTITVFPSSERIIDNKWRPSFEKNWYFPAITRKNEPDGTANLRNCMTVSDNIFFAYAMLLLGEQPLLDYLEKISFDEPVPFELPLSKPNIINDEANMTRKMLADMGYGQGELLVTPVQLAAMFTAFMNEGDILTPRLVSEAFVRNGNEVLSNTYSREVAVPDAISSSALNIILPDLINVMQEGTGKSIKVPGKTLAGKTGTAEVGGDKIREVGWIVCFETEGEDRRLVLVMVDGPAQMGSTKFDVARELMSYKNSSADQ